MRIRGEFLLFSWLLLWSSAALSDEVGVGDAELPSAEVVLERAVEAMGGKEKLEALESRVCEGTFEVAAYGMKGAMTLVLGSGGRCLTTMDLGGNYGIVRTGCDGEIAWETGAMGEGFLEGRKKDQMVLGSIPDGELRLAEFFDRIECVGREALDGRECFKLQLETEGWSETRFYDVEKGLLRKLNTEKEEGVGTSRSEITYADYREIDGYRVAFRRAETERGVQQVVQWEKVLHNVEIDTEQFEAPEKVRALLDVHPPSDDQVSWLKEVQIPCRGVEAGQGFEDLQSLEEVIGKARIVSLGESTHGSREIFQMKHRLVEFLATEMGFTIFSIEANMPEAYRLNQYVVDGAGDPTQLIRGMYFWTWSTEEVLAMVEWMRRFNESGKGSIRFTGFDMQNADLSVDRVLEFLQQAEPKLHEEVGVSYRWAKRTVNRPRSARKQYSTAVGGFPVREVAGKKIVFRGSIKTRDVTGMAALWWRADAAEQGGAGAFDNMARRAPKGTTEWKRYEIELEIPEDVVNINYGLLLAGSGTAWYDDLQVEIDGQIYQGDLTAGFDFEGDEVVGLNAPDGEIVTGESVSGNNSLRITIVDSAVPEAPPSPATLKPICLRVLKYLETHRDRYAESIPAEEVDWVIQCARIVVQNVKLRSGDAVAVRDLSMAQNVRWILDQNPDAKIVLWAHNGHVATKEGWMGAHLEDWYGDDHLPVGFATSSGAYTAVGEGGLGAHPLQEPPETSFERFFEESGEKVSVLDLRLASTENSGSAWVLQPRPFRSIGALEAFQQFSTTHLRDQFEVVVYIRDTTAAVQLRR